MAAAMSRCKPFSISPSRKRQGFLRGGSRSPAGRPMSERERVGPFTDPCELAGRWGVSADTMERVVLSAQQYTQETALPVDIVSGFRTARAQERLGAAGRPTAPDEVSTHRSCPATGVDISLGLFPTRVQKAIWGRVVTMNGLRWGGGGGVDDGGIPVDWQHVDRGPRRG